MKRRVLLLGSLAALSASALSVRAAASGLQPNSTADQSVAFSRMLQEAGGSEILLPPGRYVLSNIQLPRDTRLRGVSGATTLVYGSGGALFSADAVDTLSLDGLSFDGGHLPLRDGTKALLDFRRVGALSITGCEIRNSSRSGIALESASGIVARNSISNAADYALYSVEATGLRIQDNNIAACENGGILVHRWQQAEDGSLVTGNRIERISARSGGTGQYGNGINLFRANNVTVSGNHLSDCAFSAIRANSSSNALITGNQCHRSGEAAIYAEFAFEGTIISANIVDGAAIGISIANLNEGGRLAVCSGNIVRNLSTTGPYEPYEAMGFGIGIAVEGDTTLTGNVIENAPRCGVLLGWGPYLRNVVATGNLIRQTPEGFAVSVVDGVGAVLIADNILSDTARTVVGYRWRDAATGDLALDGAQVPVTLRIERNVSS